jgi:hypothetical protein
MTLAELIQNGASNTQPPAGIKPTGTAAIYYAIGDQPPVQVLTPFVQLTPDPKSLVLWCYDLSAQPVSFVMYVSLQGIYIGPGQYEGNASDIQVGLGIETESAAMTRTAGESTSSNLITYAVPDGALLATFSTNGLSPGPLFGPPDTPPPADRPAANVLFCFFSSKVTP